jgi:hypothetical protein
MKTEDKDRICRYMGWPESWQYLYEDRSFNGNDMLEVIEKMLEKGDYKVVYFNFQTFAQDKWLRGSDCRGTMFVPWLLSKDGDDLRFFVLMAEALKEGVIK